MPGIDPPRTSTLRCPWPPTPDVPMSLAANPDLPVSKDRATILGGAVPHHGAEPPWLAQSGCARGLRRAKASPP